MPKRIPIVDSPNQSLRFSSEQREQRINLRWNTVASDWFFDYDVGDTRIVSGRRVTLNDNLLAHLPISGIMFARNASLNDTAITYQSLVNGNTRLYYYTAAEAKEAASR